MTFVFILNKFNILSLCYKILFLFFIHILEKFFIKLNCWILYYKQFLTIIRYG